MRDLRLADQLLQHGACPLVVSLVNQRQRGLRLGADEAENLTQLVVQLATDAFPFFQRGQPLLAGLRL